MTTGAWCPRCGVALDACVCGAPAGILKARRERIATAVAAGFAACPHKPREDDVADRIAGAALEVADALIARLDK